MVLFVGSAALTARAQQAVPLPSASPAEEPYNPTEIPVEPPSLVPEPIWEQTTQPEETLPLAPPLVVEPVLPPLSAQFAKQNALLTTARVFVKKFEFTDNHVFSSDTLAKVVAKYSGREITAEELEQARQDLTMFYINSGYINSGATLPDQNIESGVITFRIVEGKLSEVNLKGNFWFRSWWLRNEIRRAAWRSLNFNKLRERLQLLRLNPMISRINAELKPGGVPGESFIDVDIKDTQPFRLGLEFSNKRPPSVGAEILEAHLADLNVTGHNDPLLIRYGIAHTNRDGGVDLTGLENIEGSYQFPITPWATTLEIHASKSDSSILEDPFTDLDISSNLEQYGATLRQTVYETLANVVALSFTAEKRRSETFLFGRPFSLSPGAVNGETSIFVLRFSQEFVNRSQVHVLALRSTFNFGIDAFDTTNPGSEPDGEFLSWLGQGQYVRRLWNSDKLLVLRLNLQFSSDPLVSLEQLSLGGSESVRGYRENQVLRDNGVFASAELRWPILYGKEHNPILFVAPFVDIGAGWNTLDGQQDRNAEALPSLGLGLIFDPNKHVHAQIYWGYAFNRDLVTDEDNLQDYGFHFLLAIEAF
jgi:hemolysin activation/secretion protein